MEAARGRIIAIIEEHCVAAPDWLERALEAHGNGEYGAVGGPVAPQNYGRLRDWVVYFCEYNNQMPPWQDGETTSLGSANIAYKREALLRYKDLLHTGYWEAGLHWRMLADGIKFRSAPQMVVYHCGPFNFGYYLEQRFWFSRAFSSARGLTAAKKLVYICLSPCGQVHTDFAAAGACAAGVCDGRGCGLCGGAGRFPAEGGVAWRTRIKSGASRHFRWWWRL